MDSDHPDIHPAGWCEATGHPLKIPPSDTKTQQSHGNGRDFALKKRDFQTGAAALAGLSSLVCVCSCEGASCDGPVLVPFVGSLQTHQQPQSQVQLPQQVCASVSPVLSLDWFDLSVTKKKNLTGAGSVRLQVVMVRDT